MILTTQARRGLVRTVVRIPTLTRIRVSAGGGRGGPGGRGGRGGPAAAVVSHSLCRCLVTAKRRLFEVVQPAILEKTCHACVMCQGPIKSFLEIQYPGTVLYPASWTKSSASKGERNFLSKTRPHL